MGCGGSSAAAAQQPQPQVQSPASVEGKLVPGQPAIIRNCLNARLNGERVICEKYDAHLGEWLVKGDKFPLTVGMSIGAQFLEGIGSRSSDSLQPAPTLLNSDKCGVKLVPGKYQDLLKTKLEEKCMAALYCSKENVGEIVSDVHEHANRIIQEGSGLGTSGECPFASAYEVHLYYQFCLDVSTKWSYHHLGQDERMDNQFFSQINDLCEILGFLDTDAVPLPEEIANNIQLVQREALFPNWVLGQNRLQVEEERTAAVTLCLAIGRKWRLEETEVFQKALASLESNN